MTRGARHGSLQAEPEVKVMLTEQLRTTARPGDWIRTHGTAHAAPRHGQIVEVVGPPGHECYKVRWADQVESLFVPSDGDEITRHHPYAGNRAG
jgi:hypothetical protein